MILRLLIISFLINTNQYIDQYCLNLIRNFEKTNKVKLYKTIDNSTYLSNKNLYFLHLSKLYEGNDICIAIYQMSDGKIIVSNNTNNKFNFNEVNKILLQLSKKLISSNKAKKILFNIQKNKRSYYFDNKLLIKNINFVIDNFKLLKNQIKNIIFYSTGNNITHAEMKILNYIIKNKKQISNQGLIITSKLNCICCYKIINIFNKYYKYDLLSIGTHGRVYSDWNYPLLLNEKIKLKFKKKLIKKYILLKLSSPKKLYEYLHKEYLPKAISLP